MSAILERLVHKINTAHVDPLPSDNIFMEDMFEPEFYSNMLKKLPDFLSYEPLQGTQNRLLLALNPETLSRLTETDREFWQNMYDILVSEPLRRALVSKFSDTIYKRFGGELPEMVTVPILYRDYPGYYIKIHPDSLTKVATMQFYLPADHSQIHLGTSFHQKEGEEFRELKTNPFKPNSAYAFVRTDNSWHSVKPMANNELIRDSLALTIYIKGQEYKPSPRHLEGYS